MAVITPAIGTPGATAKAHRQAFSALVGQDVETFVNSATAVGPGHGLVRSGHLAVSEKSGTANMSVDVAKGIAFITGDSSLAQGVYIATNDAVTNLAISAADATNPRWDLVVFQVRDNAEDSSGSTDARLTVVTGTPAGSPADPTIPDGCLVLARVVVAANVTSIVNANITNLAGVAYGSNWHQAWGKVGHAIITANVTGVGPAEEDITGMTATWTAAPSRLYRTSFALKLTTFAAAWTDPDSAPRVKLADSSNTQITDAKPQAMYTEGSDILEVRGSVIETGLSGSTTRKLRGQSLTGGGGDTFTVYAQATVPAYILVEDIGPA